MYESRTEVADHLERAADLLLTKGLARGSLIDMEGRICAGRALVESSDDNDIRKCHVMAGDQLLAICPATALEFARWLISEFPHERWGYDFLHGGVDMTPGAVIVYLNDHTEVDMAEQMRLCAKELRADAPPGV